jgi:2-keto-3-deoxy-L-arabinonate dehydratase
MPRLSEGERDRVTEVVVAQAGGRVPVVVLATAESAHLAAVLAHRAAERGAAAVMVSPPTFELGPGGPTAFYRELAARTSVPIVLQDIPVARVSGSVAAELHREHPGRIALKVEVEPTPLAVADAVAATGGEIPVFGGAGGLRFYSELVRGAVGTMPGCVVPELFVEVWRHWLEGDREAARRAFERFVPFLAVTGAPGLLLAFYRELLVLRGVFSSSAARQPAAELSETDRAELRELVESLELPRVGV